MTFDFAPAKAVVTAHSTDLTPPVGKTREIYMQDFDQAVALFDKITAEGVEDYRHAARIAVDMSIALIQIALAGLAAFVAFTQVSEYPALVSWRTLLMVATGLSFFVSIMLGAVVVSGIWQRGEGRRESKPYAPWSTAPAGRPINWQARLGVLAVLLFTYLVLSRPGSQAAKRFELSLPGGDQFTTSGEVVISGSWQNLYIVSKKTQDKSQLPPTKAGQSDSITISPK